MSSESSDNHHVNSDDKNDPTENQPLKLRFSLSSIMNRAKPKTEPNVETNNVSGGIGIGIGNEQDRSTGSTFVSETPRNFEEPEDEDTSDGEDSNESVSASASLTKNNVHSHAHAHAHARDPDSNHEIEEARSRSIMKEPDEEMYSSSGIIDDDKSQEEDKDSQMGMDEEEKKSRTRSTRTPSFDGKDPLATASSAPTESLMAAAGGGMGVGGGVGVGVGVEDSASNHSGSTSKKKDENSSQENDNKTSRSAAAAERELLGFREPVAAVAAPTTSFLDSLSEEQRRVRTRHLPDVSGFRRLHKAEIKRDLVLVRKLLKASSSKGAGAKKVDDENEKDTEIEKMLVDGNANGNGGSEEESNQSDDDAPTDRSDNVRRGQIDEVILTKILENPDLPNIFSLPYMESPYICTDVEGKSPNNNPSLFSSPQVVESISAFNPPRPPESVGPKKIHRLSRWERRPQDVEVDLSNYRKTVNRTRQELHKAEDENYKVEVVGQHLRAHFMSQSQFMRHEIDLLNDNYDITQAQCIEAADLLTSKTRSRGTARASNVMKDVLSDLKARGEKSTFDGQNTGIPSNGEWCASGVGGISMSEAPRLASGWLLPGEKVSSPYGVGTVAHSFGPRILDATEELPCHLRSDRPQSQLSSARKIKGGGASIFLPPRICVKLPFGLGYFRPEVLKSLENVAAYNDEKLAKRWLSMIESSASMGTSIDAAAIDNHDTCYPVVSATSSAVGERMDDDLTETSTVPDVSMGNTDSNKTDAQNESGKLLPYCSSLLPSSAHRGGGLEDMPIEVLEESVGKMIDDSSGVLGAYDNPNVPNEYKEWEVNREELRRLQGRAMQLKNKVYRQKRLRFLNERSCLTGKDRRGRFEILLSDMKSDLDSLKGRLKEELHELSIDQVKASELLSKYDAGDDSAASADDSELEYYGEKRKAEEDQFEKSSRQKVDEEIPIHDPFPSKFE